MRAHAPATERVWVGANDAAYYRLLQRLWAARESFLLVEHDIEIHADVVAAASACDEPWCVWPYQRHARRETLVTSLGCTRFHARLLAAQPDLLADVPHAWNTLDQAISPRLQAAGYQPHIHAPPVTHHH